MEETLAFKVKIDGVEREIKSLKDLKQAKKDATDAFLKGDKDAIKTLAELKDKTEDLTDATKTLKGSGVEKINSSFSQLGEGLRNFDGDKIKTAFKGIGSAMSAIPIFLLIEGLKYLFENFEEVSKAVKNFFNIASDAERKVKSLELAMAELKKTNEGLVSSLENEIKILEAQGNNQEKILALRKQIIAQKIKEAEADIILQKSRIQEILTNNSLIESFYKVGAANARRFGQDKEAAAFDALYAKEKNERLKESTEALRTDLITINNLKTDAKVADIKRDNELTASYKKHLDDKKKADEEYLRTQQERNNQTQVWFDEQNKRDADRLKKQTEDEATANENRKLLDIEIQEEKDKRDKLASEKKRKQDEEDLANAKRLKKDEQDFAFNVANQGIQAAISISDAYFAYKLNGVKKGSAEELRIEKQKFEANKKLQLAQATIQGIQAVLAAYSSGAAIPVIGAVAGPAFALLAGIAAATNIAKIANTKFDGGGATSPTTSGGGSPTVPNIPQAPTIAPQNNQSTLFDENGNRTGSSERKINQTINFNASIGVDEINKKQERVQVLENQNTF